MTNKKKQASIVALETTTPSELSAPPKQKMEPNVKKRWLAALEGKKYKQATWALCRTNGKKIEGYCCLGVLCDLYRTSKANVGKVHWQSTEEDSQSFYGKTDALPKEVIKWAGLAEENPNITISHFWKEYNDKFKKAKIKKFGRNGAGLTDLAELNDNGFTFKQIAHMIREEL